ncbi:hypothetical protein N9Y18_05510 [Litoricolaceae bacterium]|nr:hypothetical protein [Litorivicinaceae bacterium]
MNIHHKFVALFNATPGVYANTPSLNDTNALIGFIETVTGIDVTEDSDFIDHVLTNMGFVQDENSDLWDTAHGAMTGLVSANGRASAVDTAIQFLSTLGTDPTSDYFIPANRLMSKVSGSTAATEANSTEGNAAVLTDVFSEGFTDLNIRQGTVANGNEISTEFLLIDTPVDLAYAYLQDGVDGVDATTMFPNESILTVDGGRIQNSLVWNNLDVTSTNQLRFGHGRTDVTSKALVDIQSSTIAVTGDGNDFTVGIELGDTLQLPPAFTVRLSDSALTVSDDIKVAEDRSNNAVLEITGSSVDVGDEFKIGERYTPQDSQNFSSDSPVKGVVTIDSSTVNVGDEIKLAANGGNATLNLLGSTVGASDRILVGYNYAIEDGFDYTSSLTSEAVVNINGNSILTTDTLSMAGDRATIGSVNVDNSTLEISDRIFVADVWWENWEDSSISTGASGSLSANSSTINMETEGSRPWYPELVVGRGDLATATATFSSSELNGLRAFSVGGDSSSSETTELGARGTLSLVDSTITYLSSSNPSGAAGYHMVGGYGGVGVVTMTNSTHTYTVNSPIAVEDSGGYYYAGFHVGRSQSSLTSGDEYDGTYIANNSTLTLRNQDTGNADLFFTVGARGSARGYAEFSNGSSLVIDSNNTEAAESGISVSGRSETYGNFVIDASQVSISGSAMLNSVDIGDRGAGDMEVSNGGTLIVTTIGDGSNAGTVRVGDKAGAGTLTIDGAGSVVGGDAYTTMTIGERPESQYNASPTYEADATADTYAGTTGSVTLTNGALLQFGTAGDGIADIFVGDGGSLIASGDSTVIGDIQIIGTGTVSDNLLAFVI